MNVQGNARAFREPVEKPKVVEAPERDFSTGFDYRVQIRDAKTGRIHAIQHYAMHIRNGETLLERPIGSGNAFFQNGEPAGRWDFNEWKKIGQEHIKVAASPENREQELAQQLEMANLELEALRAEAKALAEQRKK